ncbi:MAG: cell wall-binding repeat-containing protein [Acidimicrobiia bacterium]
MQAVTRKSRITVALAVTAAVLGGAATLPARATPGFTLARLAGEDRYATAAAIARDSFDTAERVVIASGEQFPDALAGSYLAGRREAPVLLSARSGVPAATLETIEALGAESAILLGGEAALSAAVEATLSGAGLTVERVAGPDRFATAAAVAAAGGETDDAVALLASGRAFPDALAAGALAYGAGLPLLLTEPGSLSAPAAAALDDLEIGTVVVLGGTAAVSPAVEDSLRAQGLTTLRVAGSDRFATAVAIADYAVTEHGFGRDHVEAATGTSFPDALAGAAHAGTLRSTVLLAEPDPAIGPAAQYLREHTAEVEDGHVLGGTGALSSAAQASLEAAGRGEAPQTSRAAAAAAYRDVLLPALAVPVDWTGSVAGCNPGQPSAAAQQAALTAVNYFRGLASLVPVTFDVTLSARAQQAALMMLAQDDLSHDPGPDWACYTPEGALGAASSNLSSLPGGAVAIADWVRDTGDNNTAAGHRRWILNADQQRMGNGATSASGALFVTEPGPPVAGTPPWAPWPAADFFPVQLEPDGRWSLTSNRGANFAGATVTVRRGGQVVPVTVYPPVTGFANNTVVWEVATGYGPGAPDQAFDVTVDGIVLDGATVSHSYVVTLFDALT